MGGSGIAGERRNGLRDRPRPAHEQRLPAPLSRRMRDCFEEAGVRGASLLSRMPDAGPGHAAADLWHRRAFPPAMLFHAATANGSHTPTKPWISRFRRGPLTVWENRAGRPAGIARCEATVAALSAPGLFSTNAGGRRRGGACELFGVRGEADARHDGAGLRQVPDYLGEPSHGLRLLRVLFCEGPTRPADTRPKPGSSRARTFVAHCGWTAIGSLGQVGDSRRWRWTPHHGQGPRRRLALVTVRDGGLKPDSAKALCFVQAGGRVACGLVLQPTQARKV